MCGFLTDFESLPGWTNLRTLDGGHFHPTETLADKVTSTLLFAPGLLLHLSRGVRWDSDHVVVLDDPTKSVLEEIVSCEKLSRVRLALDFFDASINRVAALVIGARAAKQALLGALLKPHARLKQLEAEGDFTARLALVEQSKLLPVGTVWKEFCGRAGAPPEGEWLPIIKAYERDVMLARI